MRLRRAPRHGGNVAAEAVVPPGRAPKLDESPDLLVGLEEMLQQNGYQQQQHTHQSPPPVPDYRHPDGGSTPSVPPGSGRISQQASQQPGAQQSQDGITGESDQPSRPQSEMEHQSKKPRVKAAAGAGSPADPDGSSSGSDDDQVSRKASPKGNGRRKSSANDDRGDKSESRSKRQKQEDVNGDISIDAEIEAITKTLGIRAMEWLLDTVDPHISPISAQLETMVPYRLAKRLEDAYGVGLEGHKFTIGDYFDVDGTRHGGEAWQALERAEFHQRWNLILGNLISGDKDACMELYQRLVQAEQWSVVPPLDFDGEEDGLDKLKQFFYRSAVS